MNNCDAKEIPVKSKAELKAERRAIQEAQRLAKSAKNVSSNNAPKSQKAKSNDSPEENKETNSENKNKIVISATEEKVIGRRPQESRRVHLFKHLEQPDKCIDVLSSLGLGLCFPIHPAFLAVGINFDEGHIIGSNGRCLAFLGALESLISTFTPKSLSKLLGSSTASTETLFCRAFGPVLENHVNFLNQCRPLAVTIRNAYQYIKLILNRLDLVEDWDKCRSSLQNAINDFKRESIFIAGTEIADRTIPLIRPGECICTFGYSSLVARVLERAWLSSSKSSHQTEASTIPTEPFNNKATNNKESCLFSVLIVDSRPIYEGRRMLIRLAKSGIPCEYTHIGALPSLAHKITLAIVGAHALLSNGCVLAPVGTGQMANILTFIAHAPILVCAETYKFWERAYSDAFEYNELKDPDDVWRGPRGKSMDYKEGIKGYEPNGLPSRIGTINTDLSNWRENSNLNLLHLAYDNLPPALVTAVVTEKGTLPTTSVPVVLRVKQASAMPI